MRRGRSAAALKKLRKKYKLGEFSRKARRRRGRRRAEIEADRREGRQRVSGRRSTARKRKSYPFKRGYPKGTLGYPGTSVKEDFYRSIGVPELGFGSKTNK